MAIEAGNMELFCVQWNVSVETRWHTVVDKLIKHSSNRNPNQSRNQWLTPLVPAPAINLVIASPGAMLFALGSWGLLHFTKLGKFPRKGVFFLFCFFCIMNRKLNPQHKFLSWFFSDGVQPYEIEVTSGFWRRRLRFTEVILPKSHGCYTSQSEFKSILFPTKARTFNPLFYSLCSSLRGRSWD